MAIAGRTGNSCMKILAGLAAGLSLYANAAGIQDAASALAKGDLKNAGSISVSLGGSKSQSRSESQSDTAAGSAIAAGGKGPWSNSFLARSAVSAPSRQRAP